MEKNILLVMTGGGLGSACRYLFTFWATRWFGTEYPWGTLGVNWAGCFLIGLAFALAGRNLLTPQLRLLFMTGFLGGLTTFSSYALESSHFWGAGSLKAFIINLALNNLGGLGLVLLGLWVGKLN
jgi:CrcB protein